MYLDYLQDIVAYYHLCGRNAGLPRRLVRPTPAGIKNECLQACKKNISKEDMGTLTAFFGEHNDPQSMYRAIDHSKTARFKPLANFLRGKTNSTDDLNLELLAWLINFPQRPFRPEAYRTISTTDTAQQNQAIDATCPTNAPAAITIDDAKENEGSAQPGAPDMSGNPLTVRPGLLPFHRRSLSPKRMFAGFGLVVAIAAIYIAVGTMSSFVPLRKVESGTTEKPGMVYDRTALVYAQCKGSSPCRACSNCSSCNWCNSGGSCGICASSPKKKPVEKRKTRCAATTKKGTQCSRNAKEGTNYCWQHAR